MTTAEGSVAAFGSLTELTELVEAFESCVLDRAEWNHRAHLAVAMWYLIHLPEQIAFDRMIAGIKRFNDAKGIRASAMGGYHETLTHFWLRVGRGLVERDPDGGTLELVNRFLVFRKDLHTRSYSTERLWSDEARGPMGRARSALRGRRPRRDCRSVDRDCVCVVRTG